MKRWVFGPIACIVAQNPLLLHRFASWAVYDDFSKRGCNSKQEQNDEKIWVVAAISAVLLMVMCSFSQSKRGNAESRYQLVFSDEFDLKDGAQPNPKVWQRSVRGTSRWNRWISKSSDVVFIRDGKLVCRAIPNTSERGDTATMLTGAVDTRSSFAFQYGKIELRMRTNMLPGNFPAAWLLPKQPAPPHPYSGEIDIVEFSVSIQTPTIRFTPFGLLIPSRPRLRAIPSTPRLMLPSGTSMDWSGTNDSSPGRWTARW